MVNGGDSCLLNNVFPGLHISGVCSDICSFNRILRWIWILLIRFDRDVIDSAANLTRLLSSLYLPALCVMMSRDGEQPAALARADKRSVAQTSSMDLFRFVQSSFCKSGRLFISFFKLRNKLSLTEYALRWRHGTHLNQNLQKICGN